ncbi:uncharacterized protein LOC143881681 isoform X2 [Tasmannia lanceolata]|uniref:uncharacterized protein LOC143881681 isoform X2 n=1 Tax=Tasmannia lanceolata TaxID=3420 RepID=UPI0040631E1B
MESGDTEMKEANPDIHVLFCHYNTLYFADSLGTCILSWTTKRMNLCTGICRYLNDGGCEIFLSEPLLKVRSSADLKNTLLHEMIHAYLWIKNKNQNHSDHGPDFQKLMKKINSSSAIDCQRPNGGYNVTIYHSFHDEVNNRVYHWMCQSCGDLIERAMNRKPSASDCIEKVTHDGFCGNPSCHWHRHEMSCTGSYEKIVEPPGYKDSSRSTKGKQEFDGAKSKESTHTVRRSARQASKTLHIEDKSDTQKSKKVDDVYPIKSGVNRNSGSSSPSGDGIQNRRALDSLKATKGKTQDHVQTPDLEKMHVPRKKRGSTRIERRYTRIGRNVRRKQENSYTVIIEWKEWYANEEEEEEMEPLRNKRTERRRNQKLLKNPTGDAPKVEAMNNASHTSCNFKNISTPVSHTLNTEGEDRSAIGYIACEIEHPSTCQRPQVCVADASINYSATSQDSPDVSDGYGKRSIGGCFEGSDRDNIVDISDS